MRRAAQLPPSLQRLTRVATAAGKSLAVDVGAERLDWEDVARDAEWPAYLRRAGVLVGSDLVYDEGATRHLVAALALLLRAPVEVEVDGDADARASGGASGGAGRPASGRRRVAYIASTVRNDATVARFRGWLAEAGIVMDDVSLPADARRRVPYGNQADPVQILKLTVDND